MINFVEVIIIKSILEKIIEAILSIAVKNIELIEILEMDIVPT